MDNTVHTGRLCSLAREKDLRVLLPSSSCSPSLTSKSGHIHAGTSALAGRWPGGKGPHLRGRMGSNSSHGCGLGAGWAGLGPRGQHLCERARATGKGAAWCRNGWRRDKQLLLGGRGFSSPLLAALPAASQHAHLSPWDSLLSVPSLVWHLSPEKHCFPGGTKSPWDSVGKESSCLAPTDLRTGLQNSAVIHRD